MHGVELLDTGDDASKRIAMILIDNAVELMIKTYLGLPEEATGLKLTRKDYEEACSSFSRSVKSLKARASEKLSGIGVDEIVYYHRLRNTLYHEGNGLTVETEKAEIYCALAKILFKNLFGEDVDGFKVSYTGIAEKPSIDNFLGLWSDIEYSAIGIAKRRTGNRKIDFSTALKTLYASRIIDRKTLRVLSQARMLRNRIAHRRLEAVDYHLIGETIDAITPIFMTLDLLSDMKS